MSDRAYREAGFAVFEDRIIYGAQPGVTPAEVARIEAQLCGPLPDDLKSLWTLCYGGRVNYDLDVVFGDHVHPFSFTELFFPGSRSYRDLDGWMQLEHEQLRNSRKTWLPWRKPKIEFLPFGGFEYLERLFVRVGKEDHGAVFAFSEGIPPAWALYLHETSVARIADSIRDLFRMLYLKEDPATADPDHFPTGLEMLEAIDTAFEQDDLTADSAADLKAVIQRGHADWRSALDGGGIAADRKSSRQALGEVARTGDVALLEALEAQGVDVAQPLFGGGTILDHALAKGQTALAHALLDRKIPVGDQTTQCLRQITDQRLVERLLDAGARANDHAVYEAALSGNVETARRLAEALFADIPEARDSLIDRCGSGIQSCETSARRIERGEMASNLTPADYRDEAERLRSFAEWLRASA